MLIPSGELRVVAGARHELEAELPGEERGVAHATPHPIDKNAPFVGLGAAVVPLYTTSGLEETRHVIADSGARLIGVYGDAMVEKVRGLGEIPDVEGIIAELFGGSGFQETPEPLLLLSAPLTTLTATSEPDTLVEDVAELEHANAPNARAHEARERAGPRK